MDRFVNIKLFRTLLTVVGMILFVTSTVDANAQDMDLFGDDSLLFGEEFDLGSDFDLGLESEADTLDLGGGGEDAGLDDWLEGFDEGETEAAPEDTTEEVADDWGFLSEPTDSVEVDTVVVPPHPFDFRPWVAGTFFEGTGFTFSITSPYRVADPLETWYSTVDFSLNMDLPWHLAYDPVDVSFGLELSSFKFENSFPAGGTFTGVSVLPMVRAKAYGAEIEAGTGLFSSSFGMRFGLGYTFQFHSLFTSFGYRWNWAANIEPVGAGWWLEPRFTIGLKFW